MAVKRGTMRNLSIYLVLAVFVAILSSVALADEFDAGFWVCDDENDVASCVECTAEMGEECFCEADEAGDFWCTVGDGGEEEGEGDPDPDPNPGDGLGNQTNQTNQANQTNATNQTNTTTVSDSVLAARLAQLEVLQETAGSQSSLNAQKLAVLENSLRDIQSQFSAQTTEVQSLQSSINALQSSIKKEESSRATGLAGLQKNLGGVETDLEEVQADLEEEQSFSMIVKVVFFVLVVILVALGIVFYMKRGGSSSGSDGKVNPNILSYISQHIKKGVKFPQIRGALLKAGWHDDHIKKAYEETSKKNYQSYLSKKTGKKDGPHLHSHRNKIITITLIGLFVVLGMLFLLKGTTTGKAIHFETMDELSLGVQEGLENNIDGNPFYAATDNFNLCVQVVDGNKSVSFRVSKNPDGHVIRESNSQCDTNTASDFAVKFIEWEAFDLLSNTLTCQNAQILHARNNIYVLPSKFVEQGFVLAAEKSLAPYCDALKECLSENQLDEAGIDCNAVEPEEGE